MNLKYLIIGAGGTGGCIAGYLAKAKKEMTLIARGEHLKAIRENGMIIKRGYDTLTIPVAAMTEEEYQEQADIIFVCVKGYSIEETYPLIRRASHQNTIVIPILNIYGTGEKMGKDLPEVQVLNGCIYIAAAKEKPGVLKQSGEIFRIVYGSLDGNVNDERLLQVAKDLEESGITPFYSEHIRRDTFLKFSFVSPMAATGAYYHSNAGHMKVEGEIKDTFKACVMENCALATAMGISYEEDIWKRNEQIMYDLADDCTTSMQKDLEAGGKTEMDGLIYEVVRLGEQYQVPVPTYEKIADAFRKTMTLVEVTKDNTEGIEALSALASSIVKDYYDPIIGPEQNDYMIAMFQSVKGIKDQFEHGYKYYVVVNGENEKAGFVGYYKRGRELYLSKLYLRKDQRGKGYSKKMLQFLIEEAKTMGLPCITLNVNKENPTIHIYEKLGFQRIREEKNSIGNGYYMDDYVYEYEC